MSAFEIEYVLWVFFSTLGVVQYAAVRSELWGIVVFRRWPVATQRFSVLLIVASFVWFFVSAERNVPDTGAGLDGVVQARWFALGRAGRRAAAADRLLRRQPSLGRGAWLGPGGGSPASVRPHLAGAHHLCAGAGRTLPRAAAGHPLMDGAIVRFLNSGVGKFPPFDWLMEAIVSDYLVPVAGSLVLLGLWISGTHATRPHQPGGIGGRRGQHRPRQPAHEHHQRPGEQGRGRSWRTT